MSIIISQGIFGASDNTLFFVIAVAILIIVPLLLMSQTKRNYVAKLSEFKVTTALECIKCNFKSLREFKREDYVMKETDKCPVCSGPMLISSIYQEPKKEKAKK